MQHDALRYPQGFIPSPKPALRCTPLKHPGFGPISSGVAEGAWNFGNLNDSKIMVAAGRFDGTGDTVDVEWSEGPDGLDLARCRSCRPCRSCWFAIGIAGTRLWVGHRDWVAA
jgi:hypothetical protein